METSVVAFWRIFDGTLVNALTVCVGGVLGVTMSARIPERYRTIVLQGLGLVTITLGIDAGVLQFSRTVERFESLVAGGATYGARLAMVMIGSLIIGSIIGTALRLHERIEGLGGWIHARVGSGGDAHRFSEGFLTASVIFCVGPLTLLGCLRSGAEGDHSYLYIKSCLDGFCAIALAASFGRGVLASVATVLVVQGGLSFLAFELASPLDEVSLSMMNAVGGIVLLATALMILEIKKIPVANLLPGIFLPPLLVWLAEFVHPGLLLPLTTAAA